MTRFFTAALFVFLTVSSGKCGKLPSSFTVCKRTDPRLGECFSRAVEKDLPLLRERIPGLQLPRIDPVEVQSLSVTSGTDSFKVDQQFTNIKIYHVAETTINKTDITLGDNSFKIDVYAYSPLSVMKSDYYEFKGLLLQLPLVGNGKCQTEIIGLNSIITMIGEVVERKGVQYLHITDLKVKVKSTAVKFHFENFFNGDKRLGDDMNRLLDENWPSIYDEILPAYEETIAAYVRSFADKLFDKISYDDLFPAKV